LVEKIILTACCENASLRRRLERLEPTQIKQLAVDLREIIEREHATSN